MGLRQCEKCSEMVDEAKAFCPGCGHAFVAEEKRKEASKFDRSDSTVQFGQTMYNEMLSDMGLNISNVPNRGEKRVDVITSIKAEVTVPVQKDVKVPESETVKPPEKIPEKSASASNAKLYFLVGLAVVILLPIAIVSTISLLFDIWSRFSR